MINQENSNTSLCFFDGVRGMLAIAVLLVHTLLFSGVANLPMLTVFGALEVFMFISGFFMAYQYRARQHKEPWNKLSTWLSFYLRRYFRIAPLYYLLLTIAYVFQEPLLHWFNQLLITFPPPWSNKPHHDPGVTDLTAANLFAHYTFLFGFVPKFAANNALPDWTIGLEAQFYMSFPFITLLYVRLGYFWASVLLMLAWIITHAFFGLYIVGPVGLLGNFPQPTLLFFKIDCFIVGILLAEAWYLKNRESNSSLPVLMIVMFLAMYGKTAYYYVPVILCALLLFYNRSEDKLKIGSMLGKIDRFLSSALCQRLGDYSYSIYLWHYLILVAVGYFLSEQSWYLQMQPAVRFLTLLTLTVPVIYGLSYLTFTFIEVKGVLLGKKIIRKLSGKPANAAQSLDEKALVKSL